jgi:NAD(P)H-dependent FMN reductase
MQLHVVVASTRPGRAGLPIGKWFHDFAARHGKFATRLVDLAEVNLPFLDEPAHPRLRNYQHQHTNDWSATVAAADAFVMVTPEYNYGPPATLVNALDFVFHEWNYKPVAFISYGGISGGTRAVQMLKQIVTAVRMMPLPEAVSIPFVSQYINDNRFTPVAVQEKSAGGMLDELYRWAEALQAMRGPR